VEDVVALNHRILLSSVLAFAFARDYIPVEAMDVLCNVIQTVLDGEVSRFQAMHLCLRQIFEEGLSALAGKENVVLPPEDDGVWLSLFQKFLPPGIQTNVGSIVVKEI
jgi:hypothetical protein